MKETLEEAAENYGWIIKTNTFSDPVKAKDLANSAIQDFEAGAKWQAKRMYSEEEVINLLNEFSRHLIFNKSSDLTINQWFEQSKKK